MDQFGVTRCGAHRFLTWQTDTGKLQAARFILPLNSAACPCTVKTYYHHDYDATAPNGISATEGGQLEPSGRWCHSSPMRMKLIVAAACALGVFSSVSGGEIKTPSLKEGDIVFSSATHGQGEAIIEATGSLYTHCGIVFLKDGKLMVLEAVQPVGVISLEAFIARSKPEAFTVRRPIVAPAPAEFLKAREWAAAQIGKDYDIRFLWGDDKLYCSELVWKIYQHAGIELCPPRQFRDYDLQKPAVKKIIAERFGGMSKLPMDEKVVAPSDIAASPLLDEVRP